MDDTVTVACVNFNAALSDKLNNLERMGDFVVRAAHGGANIVVFPETALTGYAFSAAQAADLAESIPGPSTEAIAELAAEHSVYVTYGLVERAADGAIYDSAAVVGPDGLLGAYRKVHLFTLEDWASSGEEYPIFPTRYGPLAVGICWESYCFPEVARIYAIKGAKLLANLSAAPGFGDVRDTQAFMLGQLQARAQENGLFIASADLVGVEGDTPFAGCSVILGPQQDLMMSKIYAGPASGTEEEVLIATLDLSLAEHRPPGVAPTFARRRPQTYAPLVE
jgi:5-aminopentanamidase